MRKTFYIFIIIILINSLNTSLLAYNLDSNYVTINKKELEKIINEQIKKYINNLNTCIANKEKLNTYKNKSLSEIIKQCQFTI